MPKICYRTFEYLKTGTKFTIARANQILEEYAAQGFTLTLRQLYYQFVSRGFIPNTIQSYDRLGETISRARLAGLIDWNHIEDRTRALATISSWHEPTDIIDSCVTSFRIDMWANQPHRIEVWVEKDALTGVLEGVCNELRVPFLSCRGYTSMSEMWGAAMRMIRYRKAGQEPVILHLGDHDPSGLDMTRDIQDRLKMFCRHHTYNPPKLVRLALNEDQIEEYNPPPNPTKATDSRYKAYAEKYGEECWELDALEPSVIVNLVRDAVNEYVDGGVWRKDKEREDKHRSALADVLNRWDEVLETVNERDKEDDYDDYDE
jgi:hypothetical protein